MRRFAQDCDPSTYSCTSSGRKDAKIAHIKSGVRLTRNPTRFASHVAHQSVRQNRFAITVQQLHIRVTHYIKRSTGVALYGQKKYNSGVKKWNASMCMLDEIRAKRDEIYAIARAHKAEKLWVFGSCARKEEQ